MDPGARPEMRSNKAEPRPKHIIRRDDEAINHQKLCIGTGNVYPQFNNFIPSPNPFLGIGSPNCGGPLARLQVGLLPSASHCLDLLSPSDCSANKKRLTCRWMFSFDLCMAGFRFPPCLSRYAALRWITPLRYPEPHPDADGDKLMERRLLWLDRGVWCDQDIQLKGGELLVRRRRMRNETSERKRIFNWDAVASSSQQRRDQRSRSTPSFEVRTPPCRKGIG